MKKLIFLFLMLLVSCSASFIYINKSDKAKVNPVQTDTLTDHIDMEMDIASKNKDSLKREKKLDTIK